MGTSSELFSQTWQSSQRAKVRRRRGTLFTGRLRPTVNRLWLSNCWTAPLRGYIELLLTYFKTSLASCLTLCFPPPCCTGSGCHGSQQGIHAVYDNECNVGGPGLDYRSTEVRSPWREDGYNSEPPRRSRLLMLDSINTDLVSNTASSHKQTAEGVFLSSASHLHCQYHFSLVCYFIRIHWTEMHEGNTLSLELISVFILFAGRCPTGYPALNQDMVREGHCFCVKRAGKSFWRGSSPRDINTNVSSHLL